MSNPLNILHVNASGRRAGSTTRRLSESLVNAIIAASPGAERTARDLADGVPFVDEAWITANFTPPEERTAEHGAVLATSDGFVKEVQDADIIVIGAPIYNFSLPAVLKAWIDQIARARLTFRYTENGPEGLLKGKKVVIVTASGGTAIGSDQDFATGYLKHVLGFVGITDVTIVAAGQQMADADKAEAEAREQIDAAVRHIVSGAASETDAA